jgi:hypothetical protein
VVIVMVVVMVWSELNLDQPRRPRGGLGVGELKALDGIGDRLQ